MVAPNLLDCQVARQFRAPIGAQWIWRVVFDVRRRLGSVEHVIGRIVDQERAALPGLFRHDSGRFAIDLHGQGRLGLRLVDRSVGRGVDDDLRRTVLNPFPDGVRAGEVNVGKVGANEPAHGRKRAAEFPADLSDPAEEKDSRWIHKAETEAEGGSGNQESRQNRLSTGSSRKNGARASRGDSLGAATGHLMPTSGSSHRKPNSFCGE